MVMPMAGRVVAAVIGGLLVLTSVSSVTGTLIVSRSVSSRLTRWVDRRGVDRAYQLAVHHVRSISPGDSEERRRDYRRPRPGARHPGGGDLAGPAGGVARRGLRRVRAAAVAVRRPRPGVRLRRRRVLAVHPRLRRATGAVPAGSCSWPPHRPGHLTLQIAYLPTLYAAFNRRETEVALLNARGGVPSWGPELLARTHYALGSGVSTIDTLPAVRAVGALGRRRGREPHHLPAAGAVPLAASRCRPG